MTSIGSRLSSSIPKDVTEASPPNISTVVAKTGLRFQVDQTRPWAEVLKLAQEGNTMPFLRRGDPGAFRVYAVYRAVPVVPDGIGRAKRAVGDSGL